MVLRCGFTVACALALLAALPAGSPATAHEGHDHGADKAALEITSLNRATAASEAYQIVAVLDGGRLIVTLDRTATNEPVAAARISVMIGADERPARARPDGTYELPAPELARPGRHELVVTVAEGEANDLLISALDVPEKPAAPAKGRIVADVPSRLSDGSVFLPKVTQRLVGVRTAAAATTTVHPAITLVGRIVPDPIRSGVVQSTISGRIELVDGRLPRIGEAVTAGQALAVVTPALAAIDITNVQQVAGDLEQQIALAQNKVDQFRPLVRNNTLSPERLRVVEIELENLRKRRATLASTQRGAERLVAPVDGVVAGSKAVPGQVVSPSDVIFQIVDPQSLLVEALVFDAAMPDLEREASASVAGTAQPLRLELIGRSRTLQQLSTVVHFAIVGGPASLNVGSPATVLARMREAATGIVVPRSAVVGAASGGSQVWVRNDAERFEPRPVRLRPLDAERVLVEAGVEAGDLVVVAAAALVNQVR